MTFTTFSRISLPPFELQNIAALATVHIYAAEPDEPICIGLQFEGDWDIEHGMGIVFQNDKITGIGQADIAFSGPYEESLADIQ